MSTDDVILVHVPRSADVLPRVLLMPTGLIAIADHLDRNGHATRVLHTGVEISLDERFDLGEHLKRRAPKLVGFALSWHQQATDTVRAIREVHAALPDVPIVLGGFTASRFAVEILSTMPEVAFVVHGDAERPLLELMNALQHGSPLDAIPNLVWRSNGVVVENEARWQLSAQEARAISFVRFDLIDHHDQVLQLRMDEVGPANSRVFYFSPGRGCGATCSYCAGARASQKKYERRDRVEFFPIDHVADQLVQIKAKGVDQWNACFDPDPSSSYYVDLFAELRQRGLGPGAGAQSLDLVFDCFGLPSVELVRSFAATFGPGSSLNISPETGSDTLRRKLRTFYYSNDELLDRLQLIDELGLRCSLYFAAGLPREMREDLAATLTLVRAIKRAHPRFWIHAGIIDIEPGSMLFDRPERLGVTTTISDFASLLRAQADGPSELNYRTEELSAEDIVDRRSLIEITAQCKVGGAPFESILQDVAAHDALGVAKRACASCAHLAVCFK